MTETNANNATNAVQESQIRKMTRLAIEYGAVNLSQGFPNESPPWCVKLALAHGVLSGRPLEERSDEGSSDHEERLATSLSELLVRSGETSSPGPGDQLNQYSPPCGRGDLRVSIAKYYERFYGYDGVGPEDVTVTLGATEALASALRTLGKPGDKCVIFEPFHELYPSQCKLFYLEPVYVTLRPSPAAGGGPEPTTWTYDPGELEDAVRDATILVLNTPHNPTGKVFSREELAHIVSLCQKYDVYLVTDDIYEHMCYDRHRHIVVPHEFPEMADRTLLCNSLGKSASATGWRLGWCVHPPHLRNTYRGIHDQLAVMSPHPMQYATLSYMGLPDRYFADLSARYGRRVARLGSALASLGFGVVPPQGAYYLFVEYTTVPALKGMASGDAAMHLLEHVGVACVPGDNFYGKKGDATTENRYLRFAACRSDDDLDEAIRLLEGKLG
ncbi:unnamed protein product [Pseudo-nitzschia multistriata]|uniref:Aminotransferase class I/classII large domain-containing protein n=1 Tax=Pseudo-nitzschia multistriata TaxID=183589 RepID=A0A448ZJV7_9STRA|nr:unnamed protein product [Pseudo-nitzschia multistriata]